MKNSDNTNLKNVCPDPESILSVIEGANLPYSEVEAILRHLTNCKECLQAVSFVCEANAAEKRRTNKQVEKFWDRIISTIDVWSDRSPDNVPDTDDIALAAATPKRRLVFLNVQQNENSPVWQAEVELPASDDSNGKLSIVVRDGNKNPLYGKFRLCGVECTVKSDEPATISIKDFQENHSQGGVAFAEPGKPFVKGVPVLSSIL